MSELRGYRYRCYPSHRQEEILHTWQRAYATVWNAALEQRQTVYGLRKRNRLRPGVTAVTQAREMRDARAEIELLQRCPAQVANEAIRRLDLAYQAAFERLRQGAEEPGFPQYMSWRRAPLLFSCDRRSLRSTSLAGDPSNTSGTYWLVEERPGWLALGFTQAKGGEQLGLLRVRAHRPLPERCRLRMLAIRRDPSGRWYASLTVEIPAADAEPPTRPPVGINRGLVVWVALSDGTLIQPDPLYPRYAEEIVAWQQVVSRRVKGSRRRDDARRRLARVWAAVAARRRQRAHELANLLVARYGLIAIEDYDTRGMLTDRPPEEPAARIRHRHRQIMDAAWADLAHVLAYKAAAAGVRVEVVPAPGITSTCSACGADVSGEAAAAVRWHREIICDCGHRDHVDVNAARNVLVRATGMVAV